VIFSPAISHLASTQHHTTTPAKSQRPASSSGRKPQPSQLSEIAARVEREIPQDEIVTFHSLTRAHLGQIVEIQLRRLDKMLAERGLTLRLTDRARDFLAETGYDPVYGARPLKRAIQQHVQDPLALALLEGKFRRGETIVANVQDGRIGFAKEVTAEVV